MLNVPVSVCARVSAWTLCMQLALVALCFSCERPNGNVNVEESASHALSAEKSFQLVDFHELNDPKKSISCTRYGQGFEQISACFISFSLCRSLPLFISLVLFYIKCGKMNREWILNMDNFRHNHNTPFYFVLLTISAVFPWFNYVESGLILWLHYA